MTIKNHYDNDDDSVELCVSVEPLTAHSATEGSIQFSFKELCALGDLEDLSCEGNVGVSNEIVFPGNSSDCFKKCSDFYPIGARCPEMDTFQKLIERDLTTLSLQSSADTCTY